MLSLQMFWLPSYWADIDNTCCIASQLCPAAWRVPGRVPWRSSPRASFCPQTLTVVCLPLVPSAWASISPLPFRTPKEVFQKIGSSFLCSWDSLYVCQDVPPYKSQSRLKCMDVSQTRDQELHNFGVFSKRFFFSTAKTNLIII